MYIYKKKIKKIKKQKQKKDLNYYCNNSKTFGRVGTSQAMQWWGKVRKYSIVPHLYNKYTFYVQE